ncbi:hypothetical protein Gotur_019844 [Gossypium turneri]
MGFGGMFKELAVFAVVVTIMATSVAAQAKPGCQSKCGNMSIPYPFGTSNGCYISRDFFIYCDTSFNPAKAFLSDTGLELQVLNISLDDGSLRIQYNRSVGYDCYNSSGPTSYDTSVFLHRKFSISYSRNKFTAIGCDTIAYINGFSRPDSSNLVFKAKNFSTGCLTFCGDVGDVINGSCSGIGCCQTAIPRGMQAYLFNFSSLQSHSTVLRFNPCSYGFLVEDGVYTFSTSDLSNIDFNKRKYPLILDWTIGNQTCEEAKMYPKNYACKQNSACIDPESGPGYLCKSNDGFQGNPYLSNGCQGKDFKLSIADSCLAMNLEYVIIHLEAIIVHALKDLRVMVGNMEQVALLNPRRIARVFPFFCRTRLLFKYSVLVFNCWGLVVL